MHRLSELHSRSRLLGGNIAITSKKLTVFFLIVACLLAAISCPASRADISPADQKLVNSVWQRLLAVPEVRTTYPKTLKWPPFVAATADLDINAQAFCISNGGGQDLAKVEVFQGLLSQVVLNQPDRLAFILGHELSHHLLGHTKSHRFPVGKFEELLFSRAEESDADANGARLMLEAGFSMKPVGPGIQVMIDLDPGVKSSPYFSLDSDHPAWSDRMAAVDRDRSALWKAMAAFQNGSHFLEFQQFATAEDCFLEVVHQYPDSYDGWANLGYSRLMRYCDAFQQKDLDRLNIGEIVAGGFYRNPITLTVVKQMDPPLWKSAIFCLQKSLELRQSQALVKANLGVAYLLTPPGEIKQDAFSLLQSAATTVAKGQDPALAKEPAAAASILINAGVAAFAAGKRPLCAQRLEQGWAFLQRADSVGESNGQADAAYVHNRALLLSTSGRKQDLTQAKQEFEDYLQSNSSSSVWRTIANERYLSVCRRLKVRDRKLSNPAIDVRPIVSVTVEKSVIYLAQLTGEIKSALGTKDAVEAPLGKFASKLSYPAKGISILCSHDRVVAIFLQPGSAASKIKITPRGIGLPSLGVLAPGISDAQLRRMLGSDFSTVSLLSSDGDYRFYRDAGVAVKVQAGKVSEVAICQVPL